MGIIIAKYNGVRLIEWIRILSMENKRVQNIDFSKTSDDFAYIKSRNREDVM